jgi:hypothetical protein
MNTSLPYTAKARTSNIEELLDMVERGCALFLRCGGGPLEKSDENHGKPISDAKVEAICRRVGSGENMRKVARDLGVHYQTVVRYSRQVRGVEAQR